jgi:hypothetical protein
VCLDVVAQCQRRAVAWPVLWHVLCLGWPRDNNQRKRLHRFALCGLKTLVVAVLAGTHRQHREGSNAATRACNRRNCGAGVLQRARWPASPVVSLSRHPQTNSTGRCLFSCGVRNNRSAKHLNLIKFTGTAGHVSRCPSKARPQGFRCVTARSFLPRHEKQILQASHQNNG